MIVLYFIIGFLASVIGALAGFGGGVFMKPILDFLGHYPVTTIGVLSSTTVLTMSTVSLWTRRREVKKMNKTEAVLLAGGAVLGGLIGKGIFTLLLDYDWIGAVQTGILIIIFITVLFYVQFKHKFPSYHLKDKWLILLIGVILGLLASFLDIGGGPHNVALLSLFFAMNTKQAGLYSIFIIFFSQISSLSLTFITANIGGYDLTMLPGMMVGGVLGGVAGSSLSKWLSIEKVEVIFKVVISGLVLLNIYNLYVYMN